MVLFIFMRFHINIPGPGTETAENHMIFQPLFFMTCTKSVLSERHHLATFDL